LRILVQSNGAALILDGHAELAAVSEADGAHMTGVAALRAAAPKLKPARIAGCGGLVARRGRLTAGGTGAGLRGFAEPGRGRRRAGRGRPAAIAGRGRRAGGVVERDF